MPDEYWETDEDSGGGTRESLLRGGRGLTPPLSMVPLLQGG